MKGILNCLLTIRQITIIATIASPLFSSASEPLHPVEITNEVALWSQSLSEGQSEAIASELILTIDQNDQFISFDGIQGIFQILDFQILDSKDGFSRLEVLCQKTVFGGTDGPLVKFQILLSENESVQSVDIEILK